MDEEAQQRITYLLQEIDANVCAAHRSATQICGTVRRHHQILRQIHEASRVWRPLFDSFTQQPAARRVTRTPSRFSRPFTPHSSRPTTEQRQQQQEAQLAAEEDEELEEDSSFVSREQQTFKTTTLNNHQQPPHPPAEEDSEFSVNSENLPRMARTPYMSKAAAQSAAKTQESTSTLNSIGRDNWPSRMSSPPRTDIISGEQANAGRQISTPPSAISSVEHSNHSPRISRNLMFEYTPPRGKKSKSRAEEKEADETDDSIATPFVPEFTTIRLSTAFETESASGAGISPRSTRPSESASKRKRKRSDAAEKRPTPVYPKTHYPVKATSPFTSPSLRRKFSSRSNTPVKATPPRQRTEAMIDDDTPRSPDFALTSPLLRTQLKVMTPNTPLSNRLVGASLDVGSVSQETRLQEYDDSFNAGDPTPRFELSLLPSVFQRGVGAVQVSTVYNKFQGTDDDKPAISVDQLAEMLPAYGKEKIEILLDALVSRRLLRPFVVEGTMFWQLPL